MKSKSLITGTGLFAVMLMLCAFSLSSTRLLGGGDGHSFTIKFPTASGLVPGSDVLEAGAKVGSISDIQPTNDDSALVTVTIDSAHWPLHKGLQASIRPKSLLGEKYVSLLDGPQNGPVYDTSQALTAPSDSTPVELDQFLNSLDPQTRASARVLLNDLGAGLAGTGENLNDAIKTGTQNLQYLAVTGKTLNNRDPDLDRIIVGLNGLLQKLTTSDQLTQMSQLITNGQATLNAIETQRLAFSRQFSDAQLALADLNTAIDTAVPNLRSTLDIAPDLLSKLGTEASLLAQLGAVANNPSIVQELQQGLIGGPTVSGGATERRPDGSSSSIFRICLLGPTVPGQTNTSCTGNGYSGTGPTAVPASATGNGSMAQLAGFLGA